MKIKQFFGIKKVQFYWIILLLFSFLTISKADISESSNIKTTYLNIHVENKKITDVFELIQNDTGFSFIYNPKDIDNQKEVTLSMNKVSVFEVLNKLGEQANLKFEQINKNIAVSKDIQRVNQNKFIKGKVKDSKTGEPLIGVNVAFEGTSIGTSTDVNGVFSLKTSEDTKILVLSYIGYITKKVDIGTNSELQISLVAEDNSLDEVVVVGYGSQKKINLTGAVDQISSKSIENRTASNTTQMLEGVIPNVNLELTDGRPYRSASYNIRGVTSIGEGGNALVLIDGVEGDPNLLNPNDIESISVLKDAASAAIYGSRAAFGVILITTKNPTNDKIEVKYTGTYSIKSPTVVPDLVTDGYTYAKNFYEAYNAYNDYTTDPSGINKTMPFSQDWLDELKRRSELSKEEQDKLSDVEVGSDGRYYYYASTDWYKLLFKDHLSAMDHNLSVAGNNGKLNYYLSAGSYNQDGLFRYNSDEYNRKTLRAKSSIQTFDWLKINNNTEYSRLYYYLPMNVGEGSGIFRNIADEGHPVSPMFNPDGTLTYSAAYTVGDYWYGKNYIDHTKDMIKNTTSFNATFFKNKVHVNGDFTFRNKVNNATKRRVQVPYSVYEGETAYVGTSYNDYTVDREIVKYMATNFYGDYENTFMEKHYIKAMIGYNYEQSVSDEIDAQRNGLLFENAENISMAIGDDIDISEDYEKWRIVGAFYRLNYAFNNKYLLEVNGRYDGSSKFPSGQQWGFFPSFSGGWRVSQEPFWNVNKNAISNLKLRASYGSLGNGNIDPYQFAELFSMSQSSRILGGELPQTTSKPDVIPNSLTWETSTTLNIGADISFLSDKLALSGDIYNRKTTDMFTVGVTLPEVFGADEPYGNYADLTTKGFEVSLTWKDNFALGGKPLHYQIKGTLADHSSVIDKYNNSTKLLSDYYEGQKVGEIWGYVTDGFFKSEEDVENSATQNQIKSSSSGTELAGDIKFKDLDGDGSITYGSKTVNDPGDRKIIGNSEPRYIYSGNLNCNWNNFSFSAFVQGVGKQDWYPSTECSLFWGQYNRPYNNIPKSQLNKIWSEENPNTYFPRYRGYVANSTNKELGAPQTKYLQSVAYVRLKNIQIGYSLPESLVNRIHCKDITFSLIGENIWCWSPLYKISKTMDVGSIYGSDTTLSSGSKGDGYNYPLLKSYSVNLSISL